MEATEKAGLRWYTSPVLGGPGGGGGGIVHGFLARTGGVSAPPFDTLNLSPRVGDAPENIALNRGRVKEAFGLSGDTIVVVNQVHGDTVVVVDVGGLKGEGPDGEADALLTRTPGVCIGVLTADCVPILLYDPRAGAVGAVHAGWKGTVLNIAGKAMDAMLKSFGSNAADMRAAIGPSIGPCCYSVGDDVLGEFKAAFGTRAEQYFRFGDETTLDLARANADQLVSSGLPVDNIDTTGLCTSCETERFFSYRREVGGGGPHARTGRQLSFIMFKGASKN
jgi:hypothetical protein